MKFVEISERRERSVPKPNLRLEIGTSAAGLDDILYDFLGLVPVILVQLHQVDSIMPSDFGKCAETLSVENEADADSNASESARTTNAMKIGFWIRLRVTPSLHGNVVIDDHRDRGDVDTTGKNVSRDQNFGFS